MSSEHRMWTALCHCLAMWKRIGRFLSGATSECIQSPNIAVTISNFKRTTKNKQLNWLANKISLLLIFIVTFPSAKMLQLILFCTSSILSSKSEVAQSDTTFESRNATFPIYFVCIDHLVLLFNFITFAWLNSLETACDSLRSLFFELYGCTHLPSRAKWEV